MRRTTTPTIWVPRYLRGTGGAPPAYDPSSEGGLVFAQFSHLGTFQDTGATTPALNDTDPVGLIQGQYTTTINSSQATAGLRPTLKTPIINGLPVLRSNGTTMFLDCGKPAGLDLHSDSTFFSVWAPRVLTQNNLYIYGNYEAGGNRTQFSSVLLTNAGSEYGGFIHVHTDNTVLVVRGTAAITAIGDFHVWETRRNDTAKTVDLYRDGTLGASGSYAGKNVATYAQVANTMLLRGGIIAGTYANVDLACVLMFNVLLSVAACNRVRAWLGALYAIAVI